mmetsp:Transcript_15167/g.27463  ORF Transcript_15167/g.27463 Transcript_15167/m.27463 type:complete len:1219 (-) Transcript_15167:76-3732(-)
MLDHKEGNSERNGTGADAGTGTIHDSVSATTSPDKMTTRSLEYISPGATIAGTWLRGSRDEEPNLRTRNFVPPNGFTGGLDSVRLLSTMGRHQPDCSPYEQAVRRALQMVRRRRNCHNPHYDEENTIFEHAEEKERAEEEEKEPALEDDGGDHIFLQGNKPDGHDDQGWHARRKRMATYMKTIENIHARQKVDTPEDSKDALIEDGDEKQSSDADVPELTETDDSSLEKITERTTTCTLLANSPGPKLKSLLKLKSKIELAEADRIRKELEYQREKEEDLERGLECILMSILDQANLGKVDALVGRGTAQESNGTRNTTETLDGSPDMIESAFASVFGMANRSSLPSRNKEPEGDGSNPVIPTDQNRSLKTALPEDGESSRSPLSDNTKLVPMQEFGVEESADSTTARTPPSLIPYSMSSDGMMEVETVHVISDKQKSANEIDEIKLPYSLDETVISETDVSLTNVLGPLSKKMGGTTGVVLFDDSISDSVEEKDDGESDDPTNADDFSKHESDCGVVSSPVKSAVSQSGEEVPVSPSSLYENFSASVTKAPSIVESISKSMSIDEVNSRIKEKLPVEDDFYDEEDEQAKDLMVSLCAHILPYGIDFKGGAIKAQNEPTSPSSTTLSLLESGLPGSSAPVSYPSWDEADIDEPGYTIHRMPKAALRAVEIEFERMVNRVKYIAQNDLLAGETASKDYLCIEDSKSEDSSAIEPSASDFVEFEQNIEKPEDLLEKKDDMFIATEKVPVATEKGRLHEEEEKDAASFGEAHVSVSRGDDMSEKDGGLTQINPPGHPDFPDVRSSGKGKMGELEYYNLPIIFKAHVTGFEPTKDLVLDPGDIVAGQYLVQSELGTAAFSTAYRCIDMSSSKNISKSCDEDDEDEYHDEVCLKVIKNTKDFFDQSLDEIKILELLRQTGECHENNILEMKTFFYHREHLIIVTELLRQNLFEYGKYIMENDEEPYFTRQRLSYMTRQILVSLAFIHKLGLVHSDVKPENILLSSYSRSKVKLIDFGSSCYLSDRQSSYIQSRSYRAPEVILGLPYNGKIDVWSLGCVIAEMYTGLVTFQNDSIVSMLSRIESICGPFPRHMIAKGRQSARFFTPSGLLYESVASEAGQDDDIPPPILDLDEDDDDFGEEQYYDIFQPKVTTLAARLGYAPDLMEAQRSSIEQDEEAMFVDFIRCLLTIDPACRPSAQEALGHPWIVSSYNLTEDDIRYPSIP